MGPAKMSYGGPSQGQASFKCDKENNWASMLDNDSYHICINNKSLFKTVHCICALWFNFYAPFFSSFVHISAYHLHTFFTPHYKVNGAVIQVVKTSYNSLEGH